MAQCTKYRINALLDSKVTSVLNATLQDLGSNFCHFFYSVTQLDSYFSINVVCQRTALYVNS